MARKALLVGINQYERLTDLRGCGMDVTNLAQILRQFAGFDSREVRTLAHERATTRAIEDEIRWLVEGANQGDLLVFQFCGHGTQVPERAKGDEPGDQLDEVLCPHDMKWDGNYITDDYLRSRLRVPEGVVLEVLLDACHSGTEGEDGESLASVHVSPRNDPDRRPRFVNAPSDVLPPGRVAGAERNRLFRTGREGVVLWSACAEFQTAADARINGVFNGAFSFYLCKHIRESQGALPRLELLHRVRRSLADAGFSQIPELSATQAMDASPVFQL